MRSLYECRPTRTLATNFAAATFIFVAFTAASKPAFAFQIGPFHLGLPGAAAECGSQARRAPRGTTSEGSMASVMSDRPTAHDVSKYPLGTRAFLNVADWIRNYIF
jgi:hypothetical protein